MAPLLPIHAFGLGLELELFAFAFLLPFSLLELGVLESLEPLLNFIPLFGGSGPPLGMVRLPGLVKGLIRDAQLLLQARLGILHFNTNDYIITRNTSSSGAVTVRLRGCL